MLFKGSFELDVNGTKRGFKFGMLATDYFCREENIKLSEMQDRLSNPSPQTAINCAYAAAKAYTESKGEDFSFSRGQVADWLDDVGVEKFYEKITECLQVYQDKQELAKNGQAPKKKGQSGS